MDKKLNQAMHWKITKWNAFPWGSDIHPRYPSQISIPDIHPRYPSQISIPDIHLRYPSQISIPEINPTQGKIRTPTHLLPQNSLTFQDILKFPDFFWLPSYSRKVGTIKIFYNRGPDTIASDLSLQFSVQQIISHSITKSTETTKLTNWKHRSI